MNDSSKQKIKDLAENMPNKELALAMLKTCKDILTNMVSLQVMSAVLENSEMDERRKKSFLSSELKKHNFPADSLKDEDLFQKLILQRIEDLRKEYVKSHAFALPSGSIMFTLLSLFSGRPVKMPGALKKKTRTEKEKKKIGEFVDGVISVKTKNRGFNAAGDPVKEEIRTGLLKESPKLEATADLGNIEFLDTESLAVHIKKTFGPEGLRHFLALAVAMEENMRRGYIEWETNPHLEILGYKKKSGGGHKHKQRKTALAIVKLLSSLVIVAKRKDGQKENIKFQKLFSIIGAEIERSLSSGKISKETLVIRAEDYWYSLGVDDKTPYTKLLKSIIRENHRDHPLTLMLAPLLAVFWRIGGDRVIKVKNLMDWCSLDSESDIWKRELRSLEKELSHMKEKRYLGEWRHDGEKPLPSDCKEPLKCVLTLEPPGWLKKELKPISDKADSYKALPENRISRKQFKEIYDDSGLSAGEFGSKLGVSKQTIYKNLRENKDLSPKLSEKIRETFGFESVKSDPH